MKSTKIETGHSFYWKMNDSMQNFGDFISAFLTEELFVPFNLNARGVHVVGSVIDDMFVSQADEDERPVVFWGCGLRHPGGLSDDRHVQTTILSVRGPLSASELKLGHCIPLGDPGFIVPALYEPKPLGRFHGAAICIPHFHDTRSDEAIIEAAGCDRVVRANIPGTLEAFKQIIDSICEAEFILTASLHGAVVAAAYNKPFAFWNDGNTDLPFKWRDFSESVAIPVYFANSVDDAKYHYLSKIKGKIKIPDLWPMLVKPPFPLRPSGLLKVLAFELKRRPVGEHAVLLQHIAEQFYMHRHHHDDILVGFFEDWRARVAALNEFSSKLDAAKQHLMQRENEISAFNSKFLRISETLAAEISVTRSTEKLVSELQQRIEELSQRNNDAQKKLQESEEEIDSVRAAHISLSELLTESTSEAKIAHATAKKFQAELQKLKVESEEHIHRLFSSRAEIQEELASALEKLAKSEQLSQKRKYLLNKAEQECAMRIRAINRLVENDGSTVSRANRGLDREKG